MHRARGAALLLLALASVASVPAAPLTTDAAREVLGLPPGYSIEQLSDAFKKEARLWHPDKHPDGNPVATQKFIDARKAFEVLKGLTITWHRVHRASTSTTTTGKAPAETKTTQDQSSQFETSGSHGTR